MDVWKWGKRPCLFRFRLLSLFAPFSSLSWRLALALFICGKSMCANRYLQSHIHIVQQRFDRSRLRPHTTICLHQVGFYPCRSMEFHSGQKKQRRQEGKRQADFYRTMGRGNKHVRLNCGRLQSTAIAGRIRCRPSSTTLYPTPHIKVSHRGGATSDATIAVRAKAVGPQPHVSPMGTKCARNANIHS